MILKTLLILAKRLLDLKKSAAPAEKLSFHFRAWWHHPVTARGGCYIKIQGLEKIAERHRLDGRVCNLQHDESLAKLVRFQPQQDT